MELVLFILGYIGIGAVSTFLISLIFHNEIKETDAVSFAVFWPIVLLVFIPVFFIMIVPVASMHAAKFIRSKL